MEAVEAAYAKALTLPSASAAASSSDTVWTVVDFEEDQVVDSPTLPVAVPTLDLPEYADLKMELFKLPLPVGSHMANVRTRIFATENGIVPVVDQLVSLFSERNRKLNGGLSPPIPLPDSLRTCLLALCGSKSIDETRKSALRYFLQAPGKEDVSDN